MCEREGAESVAALAFGSRTTQSKTRSFSEPCEEHTAHHLSPLSPEGLEHHIKCPQKLPRLEKEHRDKRSKSPTQHRPRAVYSRFQPLYKLFLLNSLTKLIALQDLMAMFQSWVFGSCLGTND